MPDGVPLNYTVDGRSRRSGYKIYPILARDSEGAGGGGDPAEPEG